MRNQTKSNSFFTRNGSSTFRMKTIPLHQKSRIALFTFTAFLAPLYDKDAQAETTLISAKNVTIMGALDIGGSAFFLPNTNFGAGSYEPRKDGSYVKNKNSSYGELYGKPILTGRWDTSWGFNVFGMISAVGSTTLGDGEAESVSQTSGTPRAVTLEDANLGAEIPLHLLKGKQKLIIEGGRQRFQIDDGFLVGKGAYSSGNRGAWWYAPRFAFSGPGVVKFEADTVRADVFMLENNSNNDQDRGYDRPKTKFEGFDVTWFRNKPGGHGASLYEDRAAYVTLTYIHVRDSDSSSHYNYNYRGSRDGMNIASLSWGGTLFPIKSLGISKNFTFYGNFVAEENRHARNGYQSTEAYGMNYEPGYIFSMLPWKPHVFYRYTRLGGARNSHGSVKRNYDPFFLYDGRRYTYGGYWPGEIVGMYLSPLSDVEIHQFNITAVPPMHLLRKDDELTIGAHFYDLRLLYPGGMGLPQTTKRHISDEIDFSAEYKYDETLSGAVAGGVAFSGPTAKAFARAGIPEGYSTPAIGQHAGIIEAYFYKHF